MAPPPSAQEGVVCATHSRHLTCKYLGYESRAGLADRLGRLFLQEMRALDSHCLLVGPGPAAFPLRADEEPRRLRVYEQLGNRTAREPLGVGVNDSYDISRFARDWQVARPGEHGQ